MTDCECLAGCPFFNDKMANMPSLSEMLKQRYCRSGWRECARHRVFVRAGHDNVPTDLYPNESEMADRLVG